MRHVCLRCTCRTELTGLFVVLALLMPGVRHEDINTKFWLAAISFNLYCYSFTLFIRTKLGQAAAEQGILHNLQGLQ